MLQPPMGARPPLSLAARVTRGQSLPRMASLAPPVTAVVRGWKHEMPTAGSDGKLRQEVRSDTLNLCPSQTSEQNNNTARHH